jgi:hypothetical protein
MGGRRRGEKREGKNLTSAVYMNILQLVSEVTLDTDTLETPD